MGERSAPAAGSSNRLTAFDERWGPVSRQPDFWRFRAILVRKNTLALQAVRISKSPYGPVDRRRSHFDPAYAAGLGVG